MDFYYASGSPYAWRVWLALEHKAVPYALKLLSFSDGDLTRPEFLAINPRHRIPAIVDDGFALYESAAILEYLEESRPGQGAHLLPTTLRERAIARRIIGEADQYLARAMEQMVEQLMFTKAEERDPAKVARARDAFLAELPLFEQALRGEFFVGAPGAVDFTVYPLIALALRMEFRNPGLGVKAALPTALAAWLTRVEALPYFAKTYPPHWKS